MTTIRDYHAHVYFAQESIERATALCEQVRDECGVKMGRVHSKPVGPHPVWSCQLLIPTSAIGDTLGWLALNRNGLTIFVHPNTGHALADHTQHAIWLGQILPLNICIFKRD